MDHRMDFFTKDFLASTLLMTGEQQAVYALTLVVAWTQGATLPADPETIRVALRIDADAWKRIWPVLAPKWPLAEDGSHRENPRQREEWETAYDRAEAYSRASEVANRARWGVRSRSEPDSEPDPVRKRTGIRTGVRIGLQSESPSPSPSPSSKPSPKGNGESISEERTSRRFRPPTVGEVREFVRAKGYHFDAAAFVAFYESNGWKVGKNPMKSWQSACVTWETRRNGGATPEPERPRGFTVAEIAKAAEQDAARLAALEAKAKEKREAR